ncbi:hypothetical protein [Shewanella algicola]|uniref:hypothetical protein n=1 Tax=Shewanella algicola TaxID=640633 RepID=UPI002494D94D|nr:hypothetical protein [Shewanella algicola]
MKPYKYIEKLTVLQHPDTKNIVRLMIEHDGQQTYGLQRSIVNNGVTRHFYNQKLWHSAYNIKLELDRRICDYEEKGFEVMTEISLLANANPVVPEFGYATTPPGPNNVAIPVNANDIPVIVNCSFHRLTIRDLRHDIELSDPNVSHFFNSLRKAIEFLPFTMVAMLSNQRLIVMSLEFHSKPKPQHAMNYLAVMAKKNRSSLTICDGTQPNIPGSISAEQSYAVLTGDALSIHLASTWKLANVFLEKSANSDLFSVYCMKSEQFNKVMADIPLTIINRSGNAQILFTLANAQPSCVTFIRSIGFHATISNVEEFH